MEFVDVQRWILVEWNVTPDSSVWGVFTRTTPVMRLTIQEPGQAQKVVVLDQTYLDVTVVRDPCFPEETRFVFARMEEVPKTPVPIRRGRSHDATSDWALTLP
jgi:hypothetical protein